MEMDFEKQAKTFHQTFHQEASFMRLKQIWLLHIYYMSYNWEQPPQNFKKIPGGVVAALIPALGDAEVWDVWVQDQFGLHSSRSTTPK